MAACPRKEHSFWVRRVGPSWIGYWSLYEGGKRIKRERKVGPRKGDGALTKTEAENAHGQWVRSNVPAYGAMPARPTLQALWERHIAKMRDLLAKGKRHSKYVGSLPSLYEYLRPLADREASTIAPEEIEPLFDAMISPKLKQAPGPKTKAEIRTLLRTLLTKVDNEAIADSMMRISRKRKGQTLSKEQLRALRGRMTSDRDLAIFDVFSFAGLRAGEARRVALIHLQTQGILETPGTKTDLADLPIPIPSDLYVRLLRLPAAGDRDPILFEQESHRTWLEDVLQPAAVSCGIPLKVDTRMLRRTILTFMRAKDPGAASRLARHSDSSMIDDVYDNADLARVALVQDEVFAEVTTVVRPS